MNWRRCCRELRPPATRMALAVVERLAEEVFLMVRVAMDRLGLRMSHRCRSRRRVLLLDNRGCSMGCRGGFTAMRPTRRCSSLIIHPPVVGAALLGLDALRGHAAAEPRIRRGLLARFEESVAGGLGVQLK